MKETASPLNMQLPALPQCLRVSNGGKIKLFQFNLFTFRFITLRTKRHIDYVRPRGTLSHP